jgi:hypothetical protein
VASRQRLYPRLLVLDEAGHFTREEADKIVEQANFVGLNEAIVPIGEHTLAGEQKKREKRQRGD